MSEVWKLGRADGEGEVLTFRSEAAARVFVGTRLNQQWVADGVYYLRNEEASYFGPPPKGLWHELNGEWWQVSKVQCSDRLDATYHASIDGKRSLCGRPVVFDFGATDTDSKSMIYCHSCKASLK